MFKYTIVDFNKYFKDDDACLEWLKNYLYPDGIECNTCQMITPHSRLSKRKAYSCNRCGNHIYPMAGTIFEKSTTSLKLWFYAIFLLSATRCGISAKQLQRELGVTYKTAWRMFHQIRLLLADNSKFTDGKFEVDTAYIGGKSTMPHRNNNKTILIGMAQRQGKVKTFKVDDLKKSTILPIINEQVPKYNVVYTDDFAGHRQLWKEGYKHKAINHSAKRYVNGDVHTNTIDGFWSLLKRSIDGVYHAVSEKYLQNYVNEYAFRYNHRKDLKPMFLTVLEKI